MDSAPEFRKKKICSIRDFLCDKLAHYEATSSSFKRWHSRLQYLSTALGIVFTVVSGSGLVVSVNESSSHSADPPIFGLATALGAANTAVNVYLKILDKKVRKHEKIQKLASSTLDSIDSLVQLSLEDGVISSDEYHSIVAKFKEFKNVSFEIRASDHVDSSVSEPSPV